MLDRIGNRTNHKSEGDYKTVGPLQFSTAIQLSIATCELEGPILKSARKTVLRNPSVAQHSLGSDCASKQNLWHIHHGWHVPTYKAAFWTVLTGGCQLKARNLPGGRTCTSVH